MSGGDSKMLMGVYPNTPRSSLLKRIFFFFFFLISSNVACPMSPLPPTNKADKKKTRGSHTFIPVLDGEFAHEKLYQAAEIIVLCLFHGAKLFAIILKAVEAKVVEMAIRRSNLEVLGMV
jgi:hypothetical protein